MTPALALCAVLDAALHELATRGLETDDRPRKVIAAVRRVALGLDDPEYALACWGELFHAGDTPSGALGALAYAAQLAVSTLAATSPAWVRVVADKARGACEAALCAAGCPPIQAAALAVQAWQQASANGAGTGVAA